MPTRNVSLTEELDSYVERSVQSGHYDNASEVVQGCNPCAEAGGVGRQGQSGSAAYGDCRGIPWAVPQWATTVMAEMRERIRQRAEANRQKSNVA